MLKFRAKVFDFGQLVLLVLIANGFMRYAIGITPFLKRGVVEFAAESQPTFKDCFLSVAWIYSVFVAFQRHYSLPASSGYYTSSAKKPRGETMVVFLKIASRMIISGSPFVIIKRKESSRKESSRLPSSVRCGAEIIAQP